MATDAEAAGKTVDSRAAGPNGAAVGGEWDLAAPDLILHEAGGRFTDELGRTLIYNKDDAAIRHGIIAAIDADLHQRLVDALAAVRSLLGA